VTSLSKLLFKAIAGREYRMDSALYRAKRMSRKVEAGLPKGRRDDTSKL
jgi:hypothetical protein